MILTVALSLDAFVSSMAYGADRIRIPLRSALVIAGIGTLMLVIALFCGSIVNQYISAELTRGISFGFLCGLGILKLFDSSVAAFIRRHNGLDKKISFSAFHIKFLLQVYADPVEADKDHSKELSAREAAPLAVALSIDSLAVGFSAGLTEGSYLMISLMALLLGFGAVLLGAWLGGKAAEKSRVDLGWMAGFLLIGLGVMKLVG